MLKLQEVKKEENDVFKRPMHVTFDCEIMHTWSGEPDKSDLPQVYAIDYFRHWKYVTLEKQLAFSLGTF